MIQRILIILTCWAGTLSLFAQDTQTSTTTTTTTSTTTGSDEIHTLFNKSGGKCKLPKSYFIEMNGGITHFGRKSVFLPGISMGVILNHHWTIGMTGNFIMSQQGDFRHHHTENDSLSRRDRHENSTSGGYGGLLLEYTLFPQSRVHVSFPLTIGVGHVNHTHEKFIDDTATSTSHKEWFHHGASFFVVEPGVKLEVNVIKHLRIGLGISYRYSPENSRLVTSPDMFNQLTGKLSLRFGKF